LGDFGDFEQRLFLGKGGTQGTWTTREFPFFVSVGGITDIFLGKGVVRPEWIIMDYLKQLILLFFNTAQGTKRLNDMALLDM
jgi:hypothetical protein